MAVNFVHTMQTMQEKMQRHRISQTWRRRIKAKMSQKAQTLKEWCAEHDISYTNLIHAMNGRHIPPQSVVDKVEAALQGPVENPLENSAEKSGD